MTRILFCSDVHFPLSRGAVRAADLLHPKRLAGWLNYRFNRSWRHAYALDAWSAMQDFARTQKVDRILFTGDATNFGTSGEITAARKHFAELETLEIPITWMAGNHDLYIPEKNPCWQQSFPGWAPDAEDPGPSLYRLDLSGEILLIGLTSARPNPQIWRSSGRIPDEQLTALARLLRQPEMTRKLLLIASHYPLNGPGGRPESSLRALDNASELRGILRGLERVVYLHGHIHKPFVIHQEGHPLSICAGSLSRRGQESLWLLEVSERSIRALPARLVFDHFLSYPEEAVNVRF